ncbi:MAG TPA: hypothetical protein VFC37_04910, partial [Terracidiphilus sp.]|nr:hypothetical protein [Terracidiphilus sp.]
DYELLFTAPEGKRIPNAIAGVAVTRIGRVVRRRKGQPQITLINGLDKNGHDKKGHDKLPLTPQGWEHFC